MANQNEQIKIEAQKAIDTAIELLNSSIHGVEKLAHIQLETSRQIFEEAGQAMKELSGVTDVNEMLTKINAVAAQTIEKNVASARDVYEVVNEVHSKMSKVAEDGVQTLQQAALSSVDNLAKYSPSGSTGAGESLKTWINGANQALSALNKVAAQMAEFTNSNLSAASNATVSAVKKAAKK